MEWRVKTKDGRTLAVEDAGDRAGRPVLVHLGTPNSRHLYGRTVADAAARGLRLISYDRPGYGESTPQPGRTMTRIAVPVLLLHGRRDEAVPFSHGQWLAARIPGVEARCYDNEGHGLRRQHIGEVHAWLAERC
jgi:pimeloyl-ACP methyl ester carboxylesterase